MSEWREIALGDVCDRVTSGGTPKRACGEYYSRDGTGHPWVKSSELQDGRVWSTSERITDRGLAESAAKLLPANSVLVAMYGATAGRVGLLKIDAAVNQAVCALVLNEDRADPIFVFHALRSLGDSLASKAAGAAQQNLNAGLIRAFRLPMPRPDTQRHIGAVLAALDELIAINERRIELLEDLVRSLYREWFVPSVAHDQTLPATIADVAEPIRGTVSPWKHPQVDFEHFSIPAFDAGRLPVHEIGAAIKSSKTKLDGECVLLSKLNPRIPRVWLAAPTSDSPVASTEFLAWRGCLVSNAWLWATFDEDSFRRRMAGSAGGTSTSHQRVRPADVATYPIRPASADEMQTFDALAKPALRQATELLRASSAVAHTRDLLLPRLVTGRLDISDIDLGDLLPEKTAA